MSDEISKILKEQKEMRMKGNLYHNVQILFAFNTNRIEGSELSEEETRYMYELNTFPESKSVNLDNIVETINHFNLFDYMIDNVNKGLTENLIKKYHEILKRGTSFERKDWFNIGEYKGLPNEVGGSKTTLPKDVEKEMKKLLTTYNSKKTITLNDIINFHYNFEKIHPFQDGNGRVGRIIMFKECLKHNITPFIIEDRNKIYYYKGLKEYENNKNYLIDTIKNSQDNFKKLKDMYIN